MASGPTKQLHTAGGRFLPGTRRKRREEIERSSHKTSLKGCRCCNMSRMVEIHDSRLEKGQESDPYICQLTTKFHEVAQIDEIMFDYISCRGKKCIGQNRDSKSRWGR